MENRSETYQNARTILKKFFPSHSSKDILQKAVKILCVVSQSPISFFHFIESDQQTISLQSWSSPDVQNIFGNFGDRSLISLTEAGRWADCIRQRRTIIRNHVDGVEYQSSAETAASSQLFRYLTVPIILDGSILAILGVANKPDDYTEEDSAVLSDCASVIWDLAAEKREAEIYRSLMDITNDWETWIDEEGNYRYCSSTCEKMIGFTCEEFNQIPDLFLKQVHPDDRPMVEQHFLEMHIIRDPASMVFRMLTKSGEERWIELYCRAFYDSDGNYLGRRGSNRDITERKLLEIELQKKDESLERSQRIAHLGSYEVNLKTNKISLSDECYRILGLSEKDPAPIFTQKNRFVHPDDLETVVNQMTANVFAGSDFNLTFRIIRADGQTRLVQNIGKPRKTETGEVLGIYGTIQDITEKKTIENHLIESENRFRGVLDNASSMAVHGYSSDGTLQYWNRASAQLFGYSEQEACGKNLLDLIIPADMRSKVKREIKKMAETGDPIPSAEVSLLKKDGSRVEVYSSHVVVRRLNHEPEMFCIDLDLSERKEMEATLKESEARFRSLVESISDIIFSLGSDGSVLYVSPIWTQLFEPAIETVIGVSFLTFLHPDELPQVYSLFEHLLATGEKIERLELRIKDKNGIWQWQSVNASLQKEVKGGSKVIVGIMRNITEQKQAELIRDAEVEIMNICHFAADKNSLLRELVDYFKRLTGFDAVGVRLHSGSDFPYFAVQGFEDEFIQQESSLCIRDAVNNIKVDDRGEPYLDCMCGHILSGRFTTDKSCYTKFGSFVTNSTTDLVAAAAKSDEFGHLRNYCNQQGYESVALIPLRTQGKMLGLFQLNDRRRNCFSPLMVQQLENLVDYVALALANFESTEALRDSEEKYRILVENASEAICVIQEGAFKFFNPRMLEISGYTADQLWGRTCQDLIHPSDKAQVEQYQKDRMDGKPSNSSIICRFLTCSDEIRWMELSSAQITWLGAPAALTFVSDITDRKVVQDALINSEIKLRDMIDNFDGAIWAVDENYKLLTFNSTFQRTHLQRFGHEAFLGEDLSKLPGMNDENNAEWQAIHARVMKGENVVAEREYKLGEMDRFDELTYIPIRNVNREIIGMTVMVRDISERKRAEQERRALEEKFFNAFHTSPDSISINSMPEGLFVDINQGFTAMTGYTAEDVIGKSAQSIGLWINPGDREEMIECIKNSGEMINLETPIRTRDGQIKICLMSAKIIKVNGENCILNMTRDISDRKQAEAQLNEQIEELRRWHAVTLGRETRIIDLKNEVNELLIQAGLPPRYAVDGESPHV